MFEACRQPDRAPPLQSRAWLAKAGVYNDCVNAEKTVANISFCGQTERGASSMTRRALVSRNLLMSNGRAAAVVFDQELLPIRAKLLEVAAALDRIDRASGSVGTDPRRTQVQAAIQVLLRPEDDRAEQIQLIFSRQYADDWREKLGV
jgi:hypothetical protein